MQLFIFSQLHMGGYTVCSNMPKRPASSDTGPQLVQKTRRVSPPVRRKKVQSFSSATCAAKKILLRLQVWNLCAGGAQIMRAANCNPFVKK